MSGETGSWVSISDNLYRHRGAEPGRGEGGSPYRLRGSAAPIAPTSSMEEDLVEALGAFQARERGYGRAPPMPLTVRPRGSRYIRAITDTGLNVPSFPADVLKLYGTTLNAEKRLSVLRMTAVGGLMNPVDVICSSPRHGDPTSGMAIMQPRLVDEIWRGSEIGELKRSFMVSTARHCHEIVLAIQERPDSVADADLRLAHCQATIDWRADGWRPTLTIEEARRSLAAEALRQRSCFTTMQYVDDVGTVERACPEGPRGGGEANPRVRGGSMAGSDNASEGSSEGNWAYGVRNADSLAWRRDGTDAGASQR